MKNIKFHQALLCLFFTIQMVAQSPSVRKFSKTSYILQNEQVMPTNAVADDFGPRNLPTTYWHGGIDFNSAQNDGHADIWDLIISPQAGVIADFDRLTYGTDVYKYGLVNINDDEGNGSHTLLFGHVFDWHKQFYNEFGSRIVLKRCEDNNFLKWGLHLNFTDNQGNTVRRTYGQISGATLNVNGTNYTTSNIVNTTDIFIPLGKSGGNPSFRYVPHLHLNTLPFNTNSTGSLPTSPNGDPTQFLNINSPSYNITAISRGSNSGVFMKYPGTEPTKIRARTTMIGENNGTYRYSHLMDMDKVELQIKKSFISDYSRIIGDKTEAIISEGGRLGEAVINHSNPVNKSDWRKTGINSNAYNAATDGPNARNPWDDYYFTDFYTRIHKNDITNNTSAALFSDTPSNSRYDDGKYDFRVKTSTTSGGVTNSSVQVITLDNFLPFITNFQFKVGTWSSSSIFYEIDRKQDEGNKNKNDDGYVTNEEHYYKIGQPSPTSNYYLEIRTSEPVQELRYKARKNTDNFPANSTPMNRMDNTYMFWRIQVPAIYYPDPQDELEFEITAKDMANNELVNIADMSKLIVDFNLPGYQIKIPTRKTNERSKLAWNNYPSKIGLDRFKVKMSGCLRSSSQEICDAIKLMEASKARYGCSSVRLELENYVPTANVTWTNENGDEISYNPFIIVTSVGRYCYKILGEFGDDCCSKEGCIFVEESDFEDNGIEITPTIEPGCGDSNSEKGYVSLEVIPQGTYSYSWSHQSNGGNWARVAPGSHSVTVTSSNGCKRTLEYTVENANDALKIFEDVVPSDCGQNNGEIHLTNTLYGEELISGFALSWSNGSSQTSLYNLAPGEYCVSLRYGFPLCPITKCITVPEKKLELAASITPNTNCANGNHNGAISLDILNGTPPYTVTWADNSSDLERINLKTGPYFVTVTDANGCRSNNLYNVPGTLPMSLTGTVNQDCGTKLYKIRLTNFPTNFVYFVSLYKMDNGIKEFINFYLATNGYEITDLTHGEYVIESLDLNCSFTSLNFSLPEPFKYLDMEVQENMGCIAGREDGEVTVYFEGGLRPLIVSVGNQSQTVQGNSVTFGNLNGGFHIINFVNPSGCTNWIPTYIPYPIINIEGTVVHANGPNHNPPPSNGSISLNITGGSQQFSFEWYKNNNLISTTKDIMDLASGNYIVKVFDLITGCEISKSFNITQNICKRQLGVQFSSNRMECSSGGNTDYSNCSTGCPKDITFNIWSALNNQSNFLFPIIVTISHPNGFILNDIVNSVDQEGNVWTHVSNIPVNFTPYTISVVDNCGNTASTQFSTCAKCEEIERNPDYLFNIKDYPGTIFLALAKACKYQNSIWSKDSRIEITEKNVSPGQEYKITWIDGHTETIVYRKGNRTKFKKGKRKYEFKKHQFDGGIKTVTVERNDGCIRDFKFRLGDNKSFVGLKFGDNIPGLGTHIQRNLVCHDCNTYETPPLRYLYKNAFECEEYSLTEFNQKIKYFHYVPNNFGNPCIGGALTRHVATPSGVIENKVEFTTSSDFINSTSWEIRVDNNDDEGLNDLHGVSNMSRVDAGGCIFNKETMFPDANINYNLYVNWFRLLKYNLVNDPSIIDCGKILNVVKMDKNIEIYIDPGNTGNRFVIKDENGNELQNVGIQNSGYKIKYLFNTESYSSNSFTFELINYNCQNDIKTLDSSFCPWEFKISPEILKWHTEKVDIDVFSPNSQTIQATLEVYFVKPTGNEIAFIDNAFYIDPGDNKIPLPDHPFVAGGFDEGEYLFILDLGGQCGKLEKLVTVIPFRDEDFDYICKDVIIDLGYDSLKHDFHLFLGKDQLDSVASYIIRYDTIFGFVREFTRHHIVWDSIRFVRYDSTRTVYYFGTDSIRSFITTIDSTGNVFTQWFENIRFLSCSPLSKKGIWHIVGYHNTENRYYLYQFDKKFLTLHPTVIPNPERGQTYSKFWSFGPAEYVSTIRSGQYTTMKFVSNAVPPMDVVLPHPFVVKTVVKWQNNQWLITGDLNGTLVIGGDTIVTEEWTKSIFIWYDWTGTVIKYKVIESEDDRIITHVATDGFEKILFTGMTIDTIFNETLDSYTIETCIFGDTITIDGIPTLNKGHQPDLTSSVEAVLQEDQTFVRFYPNPFKSGINLRIDSPVLDKISLHVTSVLGTTVLTKDLDISEGRNEIYLQEFESLPGGLYTVWIKKSTGEKAFKVIKIE